MSITPEEGRTANEDIERICRNFVCYGCDENGDSIPTAFRDTVIGTGNAGIEAQPGGSLVYKIDLNLGPLINRPPDIKVAPYNEESSADHPLLEDAIPVFPPRE